LELAKSDGFSLSDAFPEDEYSLYLPKPIGYANKNIDNIEYSSVDRKKLKKLKYISIDLFDDFLDGDLEIEDELSNSFSLDSITQKGIDPFEVGVTTFLNINLYVIASQSELLDTLMESLQYSGIGGKRTSGFGRFELDIKDLPDEVENKISNHFNGAAMLLSTSLPKENELELAMKNAQYLLHKSSGFVFSNKLESNFRKKDLYSFESGSVFEESFQGDIYDVSPKEVNHPVWNYEKPLFYILEERK
jgi:CRISPR-associated protein Csm4